MKQQLSRREFLGTGAAAAAASIFSRRVRGASIDTLSQGDLDFPLVDFHAHLDGVTLEKALEIGRQYGIKLGIPEHGGRGQALSKDEDVKRFIQSLAGQPVYVGMQAEGLGWPKYFSKQVICQLDYVLSDALTFPEKDGHLVRLWTPEAVITDKQDFMERYVAFNVKVISEEPIDIFANPTFLPDAIVKEYDTLWTRGRMNRVIDAAVKYGVAIEINSRYNIPSLAFLKVAKEAGAKFSFGSNAHGDEPARRLEYSVRMAKEIGLRKRDMFMPAPADQKPILKRTFARTKG